MRLYPRASISRCAFDVLLCQNVNFFKNHDFALSFSSFGPAMLFLFVMATGDGWT